MISLGVIFDKLTNEYNTVCYHITKHYISVLFFSRQINTQTMTQPYNQHRHSHHRQVPIICKIIFTTVILLANIFRPCQCSFGNGAAATSVPPTTAKFSVHMVRSPESAVAPAKDEVLFECELNVKPDQLRWRFRPQSTKPEKNNFVYLNKHVTTH